MHGWNGFGVDVLREIFTWRLFQVCCLSSSVPAYRGSWLRGLSTILHWGSVLVQGTKSHQGVKKDVGNDGRQQRA